MGALDQVIKYKQIKDAERQAQEMAVPQAVNTFVQAKQAREQMDIKRLETSISAAKSGLRIEGNNLVPDQSLQQSAMRTAYSFNPLTGQLEQVGTVKKGDVVRNTLSPEDIKSKEQAKYEGTKETASRAFDLRKEFQGLDTVRDYQTIKNQVSSMDALLTKVDDEKSALALDQGLITMFNKITDPRSVVRESEYERTQSNLSLANRFDGALEKLEKGGAGLTKEDREALVFGAKVIADSRGKNYNDTLVNYETLSGEFGVRPELVTGGLKKHVPFLTEEQMQSSGGSSIPDGTKGTYQGKPVVRQGGKWKFQTTK